MKLSCIHECNVLDVLSEARRSRSSSTSSYHGGTDEQEHDLEGTDEQERDLEGTMDPTLKAIVNAIADAGGKCLLVGGFVRDRLIGNKASKDIDIEVYGLSYEDLVRQLSLFGKPKTVGKSFGVVKLAVDGEDYDFSLPRRDSKVSEGHKGFTVATDQNLTPAEAALRRDFTMNSVAEDADGNLIDPFGGAKDIEDGILRATSEHFAEDPLRVLRGFQFAARFDMTVEEKTAAMCTQLKDEFQTLPKERVWTEFEKFCTKAAKPSAGITFLKDTKWLELFPNVATMHDSPQDSEWHPEGCVLTHTEHCMDAAVKIADREDVQGEDRTVLMLAVMCHDIGKPATLAKNESGRWTNKKHANVGVPIAKDFLESIGAHPRIIKRVLPLVSEHMALLDVRPEDISETQVRRLSRRLGDATISELVNVMEADASGRPPLPKGRPKGAQMILMIAKELEIQDSKPKPILMGRHLVSMGMSPGPNFSEILKAAYDAQLGGEFSDLNSALQWVKRAAGQ
tara:strand:- start:370 stop:1902 length:1533 start_codon:yes stop_codon:yes gene_type:complete